ncbi:MAG: helix-turn-helix transcriptional regulator [bacterium]
MTMLGELEQIVLLAVLRVGRDAYGVPVHDEIQTRAGRDLTLGTIYKTLNRLEEKGLVASHVGEPTPERGGRRTRCYVVSAAGKRSLEATFKTLRRMATGLDVGLEPT